MAQRPLALLSYPANSSQFDDIWLTIEWLTGASPAAGADYNPSVTEILAAPAIGCKRELDVASLRDSSQPRAAG
jgi:hypothetical protein